MITKGPCPTNEEKAAASCASVCEACGDEFACGATLAGCWCAEVQLSEEMRARLRERYERCLCPACLERFAFGEKGRGDGEEEKQVFAG